MKFILNFFVGLALLASVPMFAQTQPVTQPQTTLPQQPRALTDAALSQRMQQDLTTRNTTLGNQPVQWFDSGYGYYGTYSLNNTNYMTRYDMQGNYVETLTKRQWNENASTALQTSFNQSVYKGQQVTGYWEVTDPIRKGYYLEVNDDKGRVSRIWADDKGKFTPVPANQQGIKPNN